jgi:competence protein ComEA
MKMQATLACATVALVIALLETRTAGQSVEKSDSLPAGPGRDTIVRICTDCHDLDVIEGRRRTRTEWRTVVDDMVSRGATASDDETKAIAAYLTAALGRVNVNRAQAAEIQTILELSEAQAAAIVEYRGSSEFKTLDDLKKVPGLDPAKIDTIKDRIAFSGD